MAVYSQAILALKLDDPSDVLSLLPFVTTAARQTTKRLLIVLFSDAFSERSSLSRTSSWDAVQTVLTTVYVESTRVAYEEDRILMDVDVLLKGLDEGVPQLQRDGWEAVFRLDAGVFTIRII